MVEEEVVMTILTMVSCWENFTFNVFQMCMKSHGLLMWTYFGLISLLINITTV